MNHRPGSTADYPDTLDLEVLICTHNRVDLLDRVLVSLNACEIPPDCRVGVFVVANACVDATPSFLEEYTRGTGEPATAPGSSLAKRRLPLRFIEEPTPGKSHALNVAIPQTRAPLITFVDDDHRVDAGYVRAVYEAGHQHTGADFFCGRILPDWDGTEPDWVHEDGPYRIYPLPVPRFELGSEPMAVEPRTATPGGGNLAIRRNLFEQVGPFRLELGPRGHDLGGAEDIEWVRRARALGARLHYIPEMLQYHYVDGTRLTLGYVLRKAYERSASIARLSSELADQRRLPLYMVRKVINYLVLAMTSPGARRRRFYMTRLAAAAGEIKGFQLRQRHPGRGPGTRGREG